MWPHRVRVRTEVLRPRSSSLTRFRDLVAQSDAAAADGQDEGAMAGNERRCGQWHALLRPLSLSGLVVLMVVGCASSRVPESGYEIEPGQRTVFQGLAERLVAAAAVGDTAALRDAVTSPQPVEWAMNVRSWG